MCQTLLSFLDASYGIRYTLISIWTQRTSQHTACQNTNLIKGPSVSIRRFLCAKWGLWSGRNASWNHPKQSELEEWIPSLWHRARSYWSRSWRYAWYDCCTCQTIYFFYAWCHPHGLRCCRMVCTIRRRARSYNRNVDCKTGNQTWKACYRYCSFGLYRSFMSFYWGIRSLTGTERLSSFLQFTVLSIFLCKPIYWLS